MCSTIQQNTSKVGRCTILSPEIDNDWLPYEEERGPVTSVLAYFTTSWGISYTISIIVFVW